MRRATSLFLLSMLSKFIVAEMGYNSACMRLEVNKRSYEHSNDLTPPLCSRNTYILISKEITRSRSREPLEVSNADSNETLFIYNISYVNRMNLKK